MASESPALVGDDELEALDRLPVDGGGTPFQREVWQALRAIPCGQVMHYGQLAEQLGRMSKLQGRSTLLSVSRARR